MEKVTEALTVADLARMTSGGGPVLLDFYADWCEPCVLLDEILTELEQRMVGKIRIIKIDIDLQPALVAHFGFRSVPWLLLYNGQEEVWRMHGFMMAPELEKVVGEHCG
jgi:thioredoxin 1